jgi:hypothetical protein
LGEGQVEDLWWVMERFIEHFNMKAGDLIMFELSETPASPILITPYDPECNTKNRVAAEDDDDLNESKICCLLSFLYFLPLCSTNFIFCD